jgi:hypothetical protein
VVIGGGAVAWSHAAIDHRLRRAKGAQIQIAGDHGEILRPGRCGAS